MSGACTQCAQPLKANARFCARCGHAVGGPRPCPWCGQSIDPEDEFCASCGRGIGGASPSSRPPPARTPSSRPPPARPPSSRPPRSQPPPARRSRGPAFVAGILLGALLSGGGAFGWWAWEHAAASEVPAPGEEVADAGVPAGG